MNLIKNRIKELRRNVHVSKIKKNKNNWRTHSSDQVRVLNASLKEIGISDVLIGYEDDGEIVLIDGHCRLESIKNIEYWDVLILDVSKEEAEYLLCTIDPISAMAGKDNEMLSELIDRIKTEDESMVDFLNGMKDEEKEVKLQKIDLQNEPLKMAFVLVGIPLIRYGEIQPLIDQLIEIDGIIIETTAANEL